MKDGRAELRLADEHAMHRGDVATLVRPRDVHNHGHVVGTGPSPYSLILPGDDMYLFERKEYDPQQGTWRTLAPGDPGRLHRWISRQDPYGPHRSPCIGPNSYHWDDAPSSAVTDSSCAGLTGPGALRLRRIGAMS
jgi:hypothetical protein